ncbi:BNR-4 repeat-containing protein [Polaribacter sp. L3A8]|uniref:BNR-4 repeat-containing protein n=1 Tax=Polaribacter sp. L3A8 TaxID=2686361 RepID=UPI00131B37DB|nr:BNR-4 repeat-containing protein [Polaribacter sp. L3A8]
MNDLKEQTLTNAKIRITYTIKLFAIVLFLLSFKNTFAQKVEFLERSEVTNEALYFWYPNKNGEKVKAFHYAPSISPRGDCLTVVNGYIFFGWYKGGMKNGRDLMISRKKIGSGKWVTVQLPHKNTLIGPKVNSWGDSHKTISVGVSKTDGTVHVFYDHHNDPLKYIVSKKNTAFAKDSDFKIGMFNRTRGYLAVGENVTITYPAVTENDKGNLIVNYRKGSAVGGNEMVHVYNGSTSTWSKAKMVIRGSGKGFVETKDRNYAYAPAPVLAGGDLYYGFSVRWARKKADDVLNEGVYVANAGPTMTGAWKDVDGKTQPMPIQDYSPLLIDLPATKDGKGSSGGPSMAVSDKGDIHISYRGRGNDTKYHYTYVRKAGQTEFTKHSGVGKTGIAYGDRIYNTSINKSKGIITIQSTAAGEFKYRNDLVYQTKDTLGSSGVRIVDGNLVVIAEDRGDTKTDSQGIFSYVFKISDDNVSTPPPTIGDITASWYKVKNVSTGRFLQGVPSSTVIQTNTGQSGYDKQWRLVRTGTGSYFNIDNRKASNSNSSGMLAEGANNTIVGTQTEPVKFQSDKQWSVISLGNNIYQFKLKKNNRFLSQNSSNKGVLVTSGSANTTKWQLIATSTALSKTSEKENILQTDDITTVAVYPNPARSSFNISLKGIKKADISISNMLGKLIYKNTTTSGTLEIINEEKFAPGIYLINVVGDGKSYQRKLVIE